jgi:hypothetical protein
MPHTNSIAFSAAALAALMMLTSFAHADEPPLDQLGWLAGCWRSDDAEAGSGEQWMPQAGGAMLGMSRTVRGGKTVAHEFMRIAAAADGRLTFFAQPSGKPPAAFVVKTFTDREIVFENPEHEFPQRVAYRFEPPMQLRARIEGTRQGAERRIEYPMTRVSCDAQLTLK